MSKSTVISVRVPADVAERLDRVRDGVSRTDVLLPHVVRVVEELEHEKAAQGAAA
jgi:predicted transcriptional regulator